MFLKEDHNTYKQKNWFDKFEFFNFLIVLKKVCCKHLSFHLYPVGCRFKTDLLPIHNRPPIHNRTLDTDRVYNRPIHNRPRWHEHCLLWTWSLMNKDVINVVYFERCVVSDLLWRGRFLKGAIHLQYTVSCWKFVRDNELAILYTSISSICPFLQLDEMGFLPILHDLAQGAIK